MDIVSQKDYVHSSFIYQYYTSIAGTIIFCVNGKYFIVPNKPTVRTSLDYYTLLNNFPVPRCSTANPSYQSLPFKQRYSIFLLFSQKVFSTSLNCPMVIYGSCIIASNVLWAIFGQSLGNLWATLVSSCPILLSDVPVLSFILTTLPHPSCTGMNMRKVTAFLIGFDRSTW